MNIILRWIIGAVALYLTVQAAQALHIGGLYLAHDSQGIVSSLVVIVILTLVNAIIRPVVQFIFAGLNCLTLGLFSFVVNAMMFLLVGAISEQLHLGFRVHGFVPALFCSVGLSLISGVLGLLLPDPGRDRRDHQK